ncbi:MAG: DUF4430 domain-containing protein [Ruminococcaceae bacterium]|nr:DUF4430 domain-containing protein [Oscillospiraceae bacterium]
MKKFLFLVIFILLTMLFLASCSNAENTSIENGDITSEVGTSGAVFDPNAKFNTISIIVDGEVKYSGKYENNESITAFELLKKFCEDNALEYAHLDGYVNSIAGYNNSAERGWLYFFNGEMPTAPASDYNIVKGYDNTIEFKYMKYSEAFPK